MTAFNFGNPNLFVKGQVEQIMRDPATGNIIAYDNLSSDGAVNYTFNAQEIAAGFGNGLAAIIPDTTRLTGTYTSQGFSLVHRALVTGGTLSYNAVVPVCESVTVSSGTALTVTGTPSKEYGQPASDTNVWCTVRESGVAQYSGTNYGIDPDTKTVVGFSAVAGKTYEVFYFSENASAQALAIPAAGAPAVVHLTQKYGIYAKQNNSVTQSTLWGYLYLVVPKATLNGDAGIDGNQTTNTTTQFGWSAITDDSLPGMVCNDCAAPISNMAYYVIVPCAGSTSQVQALVVVGGAVTVGTSETAQIPVKYLMPDGSTVQPVYTDLSYESDNNSTATVNENGQVTGGSSPGETEITITLTRSGLSTLTTYCNVTVS